MLLPEEIRQILDARARALAQPPQGEDVGETATVVVFALGEEVYGIDALHVLNIYPLEEITPVPCAPDFVAGVVNLHGRIFSVIDLRRFMGMGPTPTGAGSHILAVSAAGLEIGLLASDVQSVGPVALDRLGPSLPTAAHAAAEYARGVTPDLVVLLDLEAMLRDRRMVVHEEV
jgi:purine-binding chemotaxis protein CheW